MKDIFVTFLFASLLVCTFVTQGPAQTMTPPASLETAAPQTPASGKNPVSTAMRDILPGRQKNTVAAVEAMPADKFNYKASADQRTFGELVVHMAETNNLLCGKAAAVPSPKVDEVKETDSKDKLVAALKASFDFCSDAMSKMDDSKLAETTEGFGGKQVTRAWLTLILAGTWYDHYTAAAISLRLNGITPPSAQPKK
jgi:DinB superfamily